ncbi:MAG: hypothetical protein RLZZ387_3687 [Chloroflexota bacterium]
MREGLVALLEDEPDVQIVGEARDGREALELYGRRLPDVVLMDLHMSEVGGADHPPHS